METILIISNTVKYITERYYILSIYISIFPKQHFCNISIWKSCFLWVFGIGNWRLKDEIDPNTLDGLTTHSNIFLKPPIGHCCWQIVQNTSEGTTNPIFNRHSVAGAVLWTPLSITISLTDWVILLFRVFQTLSIQNRKSWGSEILREYSPLTKTLRKRFLQIERLKIFFFF